MAGFDVVTVRSDPRGNVDIERLRELAGPDTAALMITNPNTLGLWDEHIQEVVKIVHGAGGLVYNDGANFNAILGIARPGDLGIDIMHYNLHKTFGTPHGWRPGSGPVGVRNGLEEYLPGPRVQAEEGEVRYRWHQPAKSIGRLHGFHGNFGMHVRAYCYIRMHGADGLRLISEDAVLNANYLLSNLKDVYDLPFDRHACTSSCFPATGRSETAFGRSISPSACSTSAFIRLHILPLIVSEALMIEPTETESKETLDFFIDAMRQIASEAEDTPDVVKGAPHTTEYKRLDEVGANRNLNLRWETPAREAVAAD